jgi:ABC-type glycerol-3-phosphate transport system substrate-binding protein
MWGQDFKAILAASLHSGTAPAVYVARDLPGTAEGGLFADITHLIEEWDQAHLQPATGVAWGYINGSNYVVAGPDLGSMVIMYRKDWFREAGIFNEFGQPGPPTDWTWDDFKRIARQLSDPENNRWGYADEPGGFGWAVANGFMYYIPDRSGEFTWRFNDRDPRLLVMLRKVREMKFEDESVQTTTTMSWGDWHNEFDASRAAMIRTFSPLLPSEALNSPHKFGSDKPYVETVGMALPPTGVGGMRDLMPDANVFGFNPKLSEQELRLAFEWVKSVLYGEGYAYRMRATLDKARIYGRGDTIYREMLISPYRPDFEIDLPKDLDEVFPPDYIRTYDAIKGAPAPPLPRGFGLTEPAGEEYMQAIRAMFSAALADQDADLDAIVASTAKKVNQNTLNFKDAEDREKLKAYYTALDEYYAENFPEFHATVWQTLLRDYYKVW